MRKKEGKSKILTIDWDTSSPDARPARAAMTKVKANNTFHEKWHSGPKPSTIAKENRNTGYGSIDLVNSAVAIRDTMTSNGTKRAQKASSWRPDIYAHAFVSDRLTSINQSLAALIKTPDIENINYEQYVSSFAGSLFLRPLRRPEFLQSGIRKHHLSLEQLISDDYTEYFENCFSLDLEARLPEIRSYDLFGVTLETGDNVLYSLKVPGIKEGTPNVDFGDTVMLRELVLDSHTNLPLGMDAWLAPGGGFQRGEVAPGFTGFQISAVVHGIDKANETIFLQAMGLQTFGRVICNVSFVVQTRFIESFQRAIKDIGQELKKHIDYEKTNMTHATVENSHYPSSSLASNCSQSLQSEDPLPVAPTGISTENARAQPSSVRRSWLQRVLFPLEQYGILQRDLPSGKFSQNWFDKDLNYEQKVC